jgi:hypothetical protein
MTAKQKSQLKSLWFARWISMCYADTFVEHGKRLADGSLKGLPQEKGGISVLNAENGEWYAKQLAHFEDVVYPNWLKKSKEIGDLDDSILIIEKANKDHREEKRKRKEDPNYLLRKIQEKEKLLEKEIYDAN